MKTAVKCVLLLGISVFFAAPARASVIYEFSGTGVPFGPIQVAFRLTVPDFINPAMDGPFVYESCGQLDSSTNCGAAIPGGGIYFSNQSALGPYSAQLQFNASNSGGYTFFFPTGAFSTPGTYTANVPAPNFNPGELRVTERTVPEPGALSLIGFVAVGFHRRFRRR